MSAFSAREYEPLTRKTLPRTEYWHRLGPNEREAIEVVSLVFPFRVNRYVLDNLIDWGEVPADPIFQLTFPQRGMLSEDEYSSVRRLLRKSIGDQEREAVVRRIRLGSNPHPAGQFSANVPEADGHRYQGLQHKYEDTVLFFPAPGQTCHAFCTYCFRWPQFVKLPEMKFKAVGVDDLLAYLRIHPRVTDVLLTGGDPLIMKTRVLRKFLEPLLEERPRHLQTIRIGTKALSYWPQRFFGDEDADDLVRLFENVVASGVHLAIMAHISHPRELLPREVQDAIARIRSCGAEIRVQAPIVKHVNDRSSIWRDLWDESVRSGLVPYYQFVERDTGPRRYFEVPLMRAYEIFRKAFQRCSGLGRTVRGPCMSCFNGKVRVLGRRSVNGREAFILDYVRARDSNLVGRPFLANFSPGATWFDDLTPFSTADLPFFESSRSGAGVPGGDRYPDLAAVSSPAWRISGNGDDKADPACLRRVDKEREESIAKAAGSIRSRGSSVTRRSGTAEYGFARMRNDMKWQVADRRKKLVSTERGSDNVWLSTEGTEFIVPQVSREVLASEMLSLKSSPYENFSTFARRSLQLYSHLDPSTLGVIRDFRSAPEAPGLLVFRGLPRDPNLMVTPTAPHEVAAKETFLSEACLVAFAQIIGDPYAFAQEDNGAVVRQIVPRSRPSHLDAASAFGANELKLHTEIAWSNFRPHFLLLICLRQPADSPTPTLFASARSALDLLATEDRHLLRSPGFRFGLPESLRGEISQSNFWTEPSPILIGDEGTPEIRVNLNYIQCETRAHEKALANLHTCLGQVTKECLLRPGDLAILNNRTLVHGRPRYQGQKTGRNRWLQQIFVHKDLWDGRMAMNRPFVYDILKLQEASP